MRIAPTRQVSKPATTPSPVKGLNAYDSIVAMGTGYAITLRNWFAQPFGCQIRKGYVQHAIGLDGVVETVAAHNSNNPKLYAFVDQTGETVLFDVTTPNIENRVPIKDSMTNARWQHINFANVSGVHLVMVNGADSMIWVQPNSTLVDVIAGDGTGNTMGGIDPKKLIDVYSHQKRLWFVEKDSTFAWYLPPEQITGVAVYFDPGTNWVRGGYLDQIITWTIDDGNGADDHLAFISSEGEVSVYQGLDPSSVETWSLQGVYYAGAPIGRRTATRYGGDIAILTQNGLVMLSKLLKSTTLNPITEDSGRLIQQPLSDAASEYGDNFGWQPFVFPGGNMAMLNVPQGGSTSFQFVMNDITKAWSIFIGYNALCWELFQGKPFFGGLGGVYRAWEGFTDDQYYDEEGEIRDGEDIKAEAQTSFDYFGSFGTQKHVKMVRPTIVSKGQFSISLSVNTDFLFDTTASPIFFAGNKIGVWDDDLWGSAVWDGGLLTYKVWSAALGIGTAFALRMLMISNSETYWASTDWLYEDGGIM